jgi:hypothetical protein
MFERQARGCTLLGPSIADRLRAQDLTQISNTFEHVANPAKARDTSSREECMALQAFRGLLTLMAVALAQPAWCQPWPTKPVRILVAQGAGGGQDIITR